MRINIRKMNLMSDKELIAIANTKIQTGKEKGNNTQKAEVAMAILRNRRNSFADDYIDCYRINGDIYNGPVITYRDGEKI